MSDCSHIKAKLHFCALVSVYFNSYQIGAFLQKGIEGYSVGEADKYPVYNSRKPLLQDLATPAIKTAILNKEEAVTDGAEHFAALVQGIIYTAILSEEF